ncbi:mitochondrial fission ELM1-domain-containing protein [Thamnocephalis sphaerospora]|uniref:Mitochondrial fission ELM1-domain-containing protein n=1 Tax=Thamnocephalis sphaerospora TaxID=78915 RepID=A0A4P9XIW2_9FUNG|nr:mitochondrial fission ELM1-domain-containing protein [Thamnocephalis sphaerospora]|eukprot:RKP05657.1 mitochondrial fission ELM1-domain-containing protein [Thamnocephalis sphaerospora]
MASLSALLLRPAAHRRILIVPYSTCLYLGQPARSFSASVACSARATITARGDGSGLLRDETWVLSNGREEEERRAIAVADALGLPYTVKRVLPRPSLFWLPRIFFRWLGRSDSGGAGVKKLPWPLTSERGDTLDGPMPKYAVACGRDTAPVCMMVQAASNQRSLTVFIGHPRVPFGYLGIVALIRHQLRRLGRSSMIVLSQKNLEVPQRISPLAMTVAAKQSDALLPAAIHDSHTDAHRKQPSRDPVIAVVVGGVHAEYRWMPEDAARLVKEIKVLPKIMPGAQVILLTTTETSDSIRRELEKMEADDQTLFHLDTRASFAAAPSDQPLMAHQLYMAVLARATHICVTAGSTQLVTEAVATGKPVYVIGAERCTETLAMFHRRLRDLHVTRRFRPVRLNQRLSAGNDPLSHVGEHPPFAPSPVGRVGTEGGQQRGAAWIAEHAQRVQRQRL